MEQKIKHFTATTFIYVKEINKTLMVWHPSLKSWLPPGGHIEKNESPEETARREIAEEVGVDDLSFFSNPHNQNLISDERVKFLLMPHFLIEEDIEDDHFHMDWIFFASIPNRDYNSPEGKKLKFFSKEDIKIEEKIFNNVKDLALYGFKFITKPDQL